ncbi:MAG: LuxR C-terminal-related transcriptional regulator [Gammaproteobacteria bacterium]|nr:LuxR C-terminal-related transcriptional regulator [Gammaproteobacteria bacterium]
MPEFEVFKYLLAAKSVEEIALILSRSAKTIQVQIKSIANKLQCSHKSEIVPTAIKYGLTHVFSDLSITKK